MYRDVPRLRECIFDNLHLICQSYPNSVWTLREEPIVETFTVSEAIAVSIESDTRDNDELQLGNWENWAGRIRF